jgi:hypothetical protein
VRRAERERVQAGSKRLYRAPGVMMPRVNNARVSLPQMTAMLWLLNVCSQIQTAVGISAVNSELTRKHTETNLQHMMKLPPYEAADVKHSEIIHYSHNITHPGGAHDLVHYNVTAEVGLISLDFISEVLSVECIGTTAVMVQLSNIAAAREWRSGVALVGDRTWGCLGVPTGTQGLKEPKRVVPMPFYRRIIEVLYRSEESGIIKLAVKEISVAELFHGKVQIKHTAIAGSPNGGKGGMEATALAQAPTLKATTAKNGDHRDDTPMYDIHEILAPKRRLGESAGREHVNNCKTYNNDCGGCLQSEDRTSSWLITSGGPCSYCSLDQVCTSSALASCSVGWIGTCGARCSHDTCATDARCGDTNNAKCDEGVDSGECPDGTDTNDCQANRWTGCDRMTSSSCRRCLEQYALGGGYCGWNPSTQECQTSRVAYSPGFGRCACDATDGSDVLLHNGKCDGIPGDEKLDITSTIDSLILAVDHDRDLEFPSRTRLIHVLMSRRRRLGLLRDRFLRVRCLREGHRSSPGRKGTRIVRILI